MFGSSRKNAKKTMPQCFNRRNSGWLAFVAISAVLMGAWSSRPKIPSPEEQAQKLAAVMESGGYAPAQNLAIDSLREVWTHDGVELEVAMVAPTASGNYPLIIYLPSLGEDANAGRLWRETWARAGYAVFSLQPVAIGQALKELGPERELERGQPDSPGFFGGYDKQAADGDEAEQNEVKDGKRSRLARTSELRYLGHEYFSADSLKNRLGQLYWAYRQLQNRAGAGLPLYRTADFSKVILAGYDLGAQTATAVLGEDFKTNLPMDNELKPIAAIILSPSIDLAEGNVRSRFQNLKMPLLVVTGNDDNDPYAISSASVRAAVWEFAPAGGKYLLSLTGDVHQLLAGAEMGGRFGLRGEAGGRGSDKEGGGWFSPFANQYGANGGQDRRGRGGNGDMPGRQKAGNERKNGELGYKQVAALFSATTAFLDTVVKNDEFAKFWISDKANKWLDRAGSLHIR